MYDLTSLSVARALERNSCHRRSLSHYIIISILYFFFSVFMLLCCILPFPSLLSTPSLPLFLYLDNIFDNNCFYLVFFDAIFIYTKCTYCIRHIPIPFLLILILYPIPSISLSILLYAYFPIKR